MKCSLLLWCLLQRSLLPPTYAEVVHVTTPLSGKTPRDKTSVYYSEIRLEDVSTYFTCVTLYREGLDWIQLSPINHQGRKGARAGHKIY